MFHKTYGRGKRVMLALHGWGGDHREFAAVASRMPPDTRLVSVDMPGYGASPPPGHWSVKEIIAPLRELMATFSVPVTLIGFCSGSVWALQLAVCQPDIVERMVIIDPFARLPLYFRIFTWGEFGRRAYHTTFHSRVGRAVTDSILRRNQRTAADFTAPMRAISEDVALGYLRLFREMKEPHEHAGLTMPIDLCHGEHTFGAVRKAVRQFTALWPHATVHELKGTGHLPMVQGAAQIRRILWPPAPH